MRSFKRCLVVASCAAPLVGIGGCSQESAAPKQATQASTATQQEMKNIVAPAPSVAAPNAAPATAASQTSSAPAESGRAPNGK
jgi:hypothetical protein